MASAPGSEAKTWYLLYTKPREELLAESNLLRQGYSVYLPMIRYRRRTRGRVQAVIEPMFPRYLFIQLDQDTDNWGPIRSTFGVSNIVYFGSKPGPVPYTVVNTLKAKEDENHIVDLPDPDYKTGDQITVIDGPMAGLEGVFVSNNARDRAAILLDFLGKQKEVNISVSDIDMKR